MRQIHFHIKPIYVNTEFTFRLGDPATVNFLPIVMIFPHTAWS